MQLFVAVATGQNVANLPPILELAEPNDVVLWVESPTARSQSWAAGASSVLRQHELDVLEPAIQVDHLNDPAQLSRACQAWWLAQRGSYGQKCRLVLVMNGGTKLTPLGLWNGFVDAGGEDGPLPAERIIAAYGNDRPAELWLFDSGVLASPRIRPYQRHRLDVPDILRAAGYEVDGAGSPSKLWPRVSLPAEIAGQRYGIDRAFTRELHEEHYRWSAVESNDDDGIPSFDQAWNVLPEERLAGWKKSVWQIHRSMLRQEWPRQKDGSVDDWLRSGNTAQWKALYSQVKNLAAETAVRIAKRHVALPAVRLGPCLEQAVARRTWEWLQQGHKREIVQSLWTNVAVQPAGARGPSSAEFDVMLALKNGILIHIECKTVTASRKDLQARLQNLQSAGSRLAQMAVCAPLFTEFVDETWFAPLHTLRSKISDAAGFPVIPFTLPGQPPQYETMGTEGTQRHSCPTFEEALENLLKPYIG